jgi:hypothetical protein
MQSMIQPQRGGEVRRKAARRNTSGEASQSVLAPCGGSILMELS